MIRHQDRVDIERSNLVSFGMGLDIVLVAGITIGMFDLGYQNVQARSSDDDDDDDSRSNSRGYSFSQGSHGFSKANCNGDTLLGGALGSLVGGVIDGPLGIVPRAQVGSNLAQGSC
jgi:hypothetical protein